MQHKKTILLLVGLLLIVFAFSASAQRVKLTAMTGVQTGPGTSEWHKKLKGIIERKLPNVDIEFIETPPGMSIEEKFNLLLAAGDAPDVFGGSVTHNLFFEGVMIDLAPYYNNDPEAMAWPVWPGPDIRSQLVVDGKTVRWGLPSGVSSQVLWLNMDMLNEAGVAYPHKTPWLFSEYTEIIRKMTRDIDGDRKIDQWGLAMGTSIDQVLNFVWNRGGLLFNVDPVTGFATEYALDSPEAIGGLQEMADWLKDNIARIPAGEPWQGLGYATGKFGSYPFWWSLPPEGKEYPFQMDAAPFPTGIPGSFSINVVHSGVEGGITSTSKHKDEAWQVIKVIRSKEGIQHQFDLNTSVVMQDDDLLRQWAVRAESLNVHWDVYVKVSEENGAPPQQPPWLQLMFEWGNVSNVVKQEMDALWLGINSAERVTKGRMKTLVNEILDREKEKRAALGL